MPPNGDVPAARLLEYAPPSTCNRRLRRAGFLTLLLLTLAGAIYGGRVGLSRYRSYRAQRQRLLDEQLVEAAFHCALGRAEQLLAVGADPKAIYAKELSEALKYPDSATWDVAASSWNALHALSASPQRAGHAAELLELARLLVDLHGVSVDARDSSGCTPLYHAVDMGHDDLALLLLQRGADPNISMRIVVGRRSAMTVLHQAVRSPRLCAALIERGARVNDVMDSYGATPLDYAIIHAQCETIALLLRNGANVRETQDHGDTPLHYLVRVTSLLDVSNGAPPAQWCAAAQALLEGGADRSAINNLGNTPLDLAEWTVDRVRHEDVETRERDTITPAELERRCEENNRSRTAAQVELAKFLKRKGSKHDVVERP